MRPMPSWLVLHCIGPTCHIVARCQTELQALKRLRQYADKHPGEVLLLARISVQYQEEADAA